MTLRLLFVLSFLHVPSLARLGGNSREVVRNGYRLLSETQTVKAKPVANGDNSKSGGKQPHDTTPGNNPASKPDRHVDPDTDTEKDDTGTKADLGNAVQNTDPSATKKKHLELTFSRELKPKNNIESEKVKNTFRNAVKRVFNDKKIDPVKGPPKCKITGKTADCEFPYSPNQLGSRHKEVLDAIKESVEGDLKKLGIEATARWHKHEKAKTQRNPPSGSKQPSTKKQHHLEVTFSEDIVEANHETLNTIFHDAVTEKVKDFEGKATCTISGATADCEFPSSSLGKGHKAVLDAIKKNVEEKLKKKNMEVTEAQWLKQKEKTQDIQQQHGKKQHKKQPQSQGKRQQENKQKQSQGKRQQENKQKHHLKLTFSKDLTEPDQETLTTLFKEVLGTCTFSGETADCEFPPTASKHHEHRQKIVEVIRNKMNKKDLKAKNYQWDSGNHHSWDKSHRKKGKMKEDTADSGYSSSTLTALAAVICILLLGLLSVFMYRFLCKKDLAAIVSETPKSKKKRKKTKTMGKKKFAKLENNFSSSSDDEKN